MYICHVFFRIQTLLIFIVAVLTAYYLFAFQPNNFLFIGYIIIDFFCAVVLFLYRKRDLQKRLAILGGIIGIFLLGFHGYLLAKLPGENIFSEKGIELIFPILICLLFFLAAKFISRDERLVKSASRFR